MDPILGRDEEIRQIVDVLMRRRQNNPILTGEAGVGKTAVVEGFAQRIASGEVPPPLRGVRLCALDIGLTSDDRVGNSGRRGKRRSGRKPPRQSSGRSRRSPMRSAGSHSSRTTAGCMVCCRRLRCWAGRSRWLRRRWGSWRSAMSGATNPSRNSCWPRSMAGPA